ncbi:DUF4393 domain-containing protein [Lysinibacillus sp. NPDC056232]|uniref:DUF4393 domain-containing protein n=1 Tax=Lysinibacillus sp. NPDC056232 TaxID=3345756 RepID=UPI0035D5EC3D
MDNTNKVKETIEAATALVEAVPIYQDLLQPAAKEIGKGAHTVSKLIHVALAPVSALVWGYDKIADYLQTTLEEKLKDVPPDNIITPDISIAGPTIEAMRFTNEELRDMFANLLASAMNSEKSEEAHPSYVEIIRQLNTDEAKILKHLKGQHFPTLNVVAYTSSSQHSPTMENFSNVSFKANCDHPQKIHSYLENLNRLGLIDLHSPGTLTDVSVYEELEQHPIIENALMLAGFLGEAKIIRSYAKSTMFGTQFYDACIKS